MTNAIDNIYDHERDSIMAEYERIYKKWKTRQNNKDNLLEFHREVIYRFEELGFDVDVDFVEYFADLMSDTHPPRPPVLVIAGRVDPSIEFDHEKKRHEVRSARARGEQ